MKKERLSDPMKPSREIHLKKRERSAPNDDDRHDKFQFGGNPMQMTRFEEELCYKEQQERHMAKVKYVLGVQGVDGGPFIRDKTEL
jgi:hypothetical protein